MNFLVLFYVVLMSNECKPNAYFEGLRLKNLENIVSKPACDFQNACVYIGDKSQPN